MKAVAQLHTQYVNRTYGRSGTLWERRFDSCLVQTENYLLNCYRYVERNPVEAGLCEDAPPMRSTCALAAQPKLGERLTEALLLRRLATSGNFALGTEKFKRSISIALGRRAFPGEAGRPSRAAGDSRDQGKLFDD
jgi:putative transposase